MQVRAYYHDRCNAVIHFTSFAVHEGNLYAVGWCTSCKTGIKKDIAEVFADFYATDEPKGGNGAVH